MSIVMILVYHGVRLSIHRAAERRNLIGNLASGTANTGKPRAYASIEVLQGHEAAGRPHR
jgi:hypothetical protein